MTTRVTPLNLNDAPGVWTGPQSMVQPSPILEEAEAQSAVVGSGTPLAVPDTLFLRDANAAGAVQVLALDGSLGFAPGPPGANFGQIHYATAEASLILQTPSAEFNITTNASDGTHLVFGGDSARNNIVRFAADAVIDDGPYLSLQHDTAVASLQFDTFLLVSDTTPANSIGMVVSAANTLSITGGVASQATLAFTQGVILSSPAAEDITIDCGNFLTLGDSANTDQTRLRGAIVLAQTADFYFDVATIHHRTQAEAEKLTVTVADAFVYNWAAAVTSVVWQNNGTTRFSLNDTGIGFYTVAPVARQSVSAGSGTLALDILVALNALGLVLQTA